MGVRSLASGTRRFYTPGLIILRSKAPFPLLTSRKYVDKMKKLDLYRIYFNKSHQFMYFNLLES